MKNKTLFSWLVACTCAITVAGASLLTSHAADSEEPSSPVPFQLQSAMTPNPLELGRGVNVLGYDPIWNEFERRRFQENFFPMIRAAGFDHVRLNLHPFRHMTETEDGIQLKESWYTTLDWIVNNALRNDLKIILDLHEFQILSKNPEENKTKFLAFWEAMSDKFSGYSNQVVFEILNEPNGELDATLWEVYYKEALAIIRKYNPERPVIIGPTHWNNIEKLDTLNLPEEDRNLIATVHYYLPMRFTHQGATWVGQELRETSGVTWGSEAEQATLLSHFQKVQDWSQKHERPIYLGEFGAYDKAPMESRIRYTDSVCRTAEKMGWSWGYWQFDSDFIAFDVKSGQWVEPILKALIPNSPSLKQ
ncbi:MAG: glycoside hydrolase family 5 protein [Limisphaerales bacterium]|jgi:endoglucanase|nr:glycoside hydrolase family 5 protein [Verrucomicrobiota bacterium]